MSEAIQERGYLYNFHFHLVWVTKYRHETFNTPELVEEMEGFIKDAAKERDITIESLEVMPDHVHMLISFKPKLSATTVVKNLKGISARRFLLKHPDIQQEKFWGGNLWSRSYYMSTLGDMSKKTVENYINNQRRK